MGTGHVIRMNEDGTTKKVFNAEPISVRRKGRPNNRWIDGLEKNLLVLRTRHWRILAGRRLAWKRLLEKAKAHPGLSCHRGRNERLLYKLPLVNEKILNPFNVHQSFYKSSVTSGLEFTTWYN
ncbi:uncharacterized protein TNCV_2845681 [Trichonephila clavipes]|nr:uncharacterized protein TNCV_2845681 [Trichonephila clavipes]